MSWTQIFQVKFFVCWKQALIFLWERVEHASDGSMGVDG